MPTQRYAAFRHRLAELFFSQTQTIPLYVYSAASSPGGMGQSARLAFLSILIAALALIVSARLVIDTRRRRRYGENDS